MDIFHDSMYSDVKALGDCVEEESRPRLAGQQQHHSNIPSGSISNHYKVNVTIPVLDHIINQLDTRFDSYSTSIINESTKILPSEIFNKSEKMTKMEICNLLEYYYDDLASPMSMDIELDMWFNAWSGNMLGEGLYTPERHYITLTVIISLIFIP